MSTNTVVVVPPTKNSHPRCHCPVHTFDPKGVNALGYYTFQTVVKNKKLCPSCYCYLCRCPAYQCPQWCSAGNRLAKWNHCCSTTTTCTVPPSSASSSTLVAATTETNHATSARTEIVILSDSDETDNDDTVAIVNDAKKRRELAQQFEIEHAEDDSPHRYGTRALMYDTDKADNVW